MCDFLFLLSLFLFIIYAKNWTPIFLSQFLTERKSNFRILGVDFDRNRFLRFPFESTLYFSKSRHRYFVTFSRKMIFVNYCSTLGGRKCEMWGELSSFEIVVFLLFFLLLESFKRDAKKRVAQVETRPNKWSKFLYRLAIEGCTNFSFYSKQIFSWKRKCPCMVYFPSTYTLYTRIVFLLSFF